MIHGAFKFLWPNKGKPVLRHDPEQPFLLTAPGIWFVDFEKVPAIGDPFEAMLTVPGYGFLHGSPLGTTATVRLIEINPRNEFGQWNCRFYTDDGAYWLGERGEPTL